MSYRYRANKDGVLSNPYKYVEKGEYIVLPSPIKASWLDEAPESGELPPLVELPVFPHLNKAVDNGHKAYTTALTDIDKIDDYQDSSVGDKKNKKTGSGDQDVL